MQYTTWHENQVMIIASEVRNVVKIKGCKCHIHNNGNLHSKGQYLIACVKYLGPNLGKQYFPF